MAKSDQTIQITVPLGERSYPIFIGRGLLQSSSTLEPFVTGSQVCIVTNETIAPLYLNTLVAQFEGKKQCDVVILSDGEQFKNLDVLSEIFDVLIDNNHHRDTTLIALGGGVIGDMTGFAAACFQRGVRFIQIPTSLLAQVDASVGGKTAVNHPRGKNMIGAFHQPHAVFIDINTLETLPQREFIAGCAEVIKHALIEDDKFFYWLLDNAQKLFSLDEEAIKYTISMCCSIKSNIVGLDETEQSTRAVLNFGHTLGHAIEAITHFTNYLHGEAVSIGMFFAACLSCKIGKLSEQELRDIYQCLVTYSLPTALATAIDFDDLMKYMLSDKKITENKLKFILLDRIGKAMIKNDVNEVLLRQVFNDAQNYQPS